MDLERRLSAAVKGQVFCDRVNRGLYATDASMYQIEPVAVVVPLDEDDVRATVAVAAELGVPIVPRGGGTSLAGQSINQAIVIDFSKHLNQLLEVNVAERWARVQAGLVRDELNSLLAPHGLFYAIDPATANRATVGGMIGNNASGSHSIVYGKTIDQLRATRVLLSDGTELSFGDLSPSEYDTRAAADTREGGLLRGVRDIVERNRDEIAVRYPKVLRRAGGYMLDEFVGDGPWNLSKLVCGSEGTLGVLLEATVSLHPVPACTGMVVVHFEKVLDAIGQVEPILSHQPAAVELLDRTILSLARQNLETARLCSWLSGDPEGVLSVEFQGEPDEVAERCHGLVAELQRDGRGYAWPVLLSAAEQAKFWAVRKAGLGLMLGIRGDRKPQAFIEDAAVPLPVLPAYIQRVEALCRELDVSVALYAHASVGLLHVRPILSLKSSADIELMKRIAKQAFDWVVGFGGSFSGEHGDGLSRGQFVAPFFGPQLYEAFREVKGLFDPAGLLSPQRIIDAPPMDQNLRYGPEYRADVPPTMFHYRHDGGFAAAVEVCNGVGACRKKLNGTMCPSFNATGDEAHSTRGRANALRLAMSGWLGPAALTSPEVAAVMDLCLSCKGCKSECPSNVDMARLKSEFLHLEHLRRGLTLRDRMIGASPDLARWCAGPAAPLINAVNASAPARWLLSHVAGFDPRRTAPAYARQPFGQWFARRHRPPTSGPRVVLFDDTYLNYHQPAVGRSAVELLEGCGYEVILARAGCCQRPRISHGLLDEARRRGERTLRNLDVYLQQDLPVLVCEPGCASALTDDLPDLIEDEALGRRAAAGIHMIDVFLDRELSEGRLDVDLRCDSSAVLVHGHCHQKALYGTAAMKRLLGRVPDLAVSEVDSGCCGMAGSFGYEAEHYALSTTIAEQRLLPAIRAAAPGTAVVACGFSCRHQIADLARVEARHLIQVLRTEPTSR